MKLYEKSAAELSEMLRSRECSAVEILKDVTERISAVEETVGAYITLNDNAIDAAEAVDSAIADGREIHPLAGIPIAVKDNISVKGLRTTCASKILENYVSPYSASVIDKINDAGMVITGKTNMDEFAIGSSTEHSYFHITHNPHDPEYVAGGSSGGSAAAVASGEAIAALGSDTGGSVRQPASFCGVVGMKPTYGRVSRYGLIAFASSFDQIGVFGKTVKDAAMLQDLISGFDKKDSTSVFMKAPDFAANLRNNIKNMRVGVPDEFFTDAVENEVKQSVWNAVKTLEANGAEIKRISLPGTIHALKAYYIISSAEASSNLARYDGVKYGYRVENSDGLTDMYEKTRSEGFGREVKLRIMLGTFVLSSGYYDDFYKRAKLIQRRISAEFERAFEECDVIAAPTAPGAAFKIGKNMDDPLKMYSGDICTVSANLAGIPAVSVPCGFSGSKLPIGMQFMGKRFAEQTVLDAAYAYEEICGGFGAFTKNILSEYSQK